MSNRQFVSVRIVRLLLVFALSVLLANQLWARRATSWNEFIAPLQLRGMAAEEYADLTDLAKGADLVVVGRIADIERGRELVAAPDFIDDPVVGDIAYARFAVAKIEVERSLTKGLQVRSAVEVEILIRTWDQVSALQKQLPNERALFFLHHKSAEADGRYYRLVNVHHGLIGSTGGAAVVPGRDVDGNGFLAALEGRSFDDVVAQVSEALGP